ncbi:flagellar hook protein FlgE [Tersicoccus solisilvae]|uniref:Flagellar hook protein FlgE n=1 Tax=Tersicoccus solisilvae TaxID=1882339 RepID=A0ABQ1PQK6_9MICC|nr:flagellar hook protein FlgE [Tersicoccus solisilvae]GGD01064.1 flagellar hook protein FlgE [Tersicoccus solisilvae]
MLRSLYSGISGLRAHQTMLDVTGNNIANANTTGFKASTTQFQDTLSQMTQVAGGPQTETGGTNPAQIGLGVKVAAVTNDFTQGAAQSTGRTTDMMISGDGFFVTSKAGGTAYTRAGSFDFDGMGRLVSPDGAILQGWMADAGGRVTTGARPTDLSVPKTMTMPASATTQVVLEGNLPGDTAVGTSMTKDVRVFDELGAARTLSLTMTRTAGGWNITGTDGNGGTGSTSLTSTGGRLQPTGPLTVGGVTVDTGDLTGYAGNNTVTGSATNGSAAGTLESFSLGADGTLTGSFSNGGKFVIGQVAMARFTNPAGLEKVGGTAFQPTPNSGEPQLGTAGTGGFGTLSGGQLEMSNVDLSQQFTNLIVAQRGFQANARIVTTSDQVLQELVELKR